MTNYKEHLITSENTSSIREALQSNLDALARDAIMFVADEEGKLHRLNNGWRRHDEDCNKRCD